MSITAESILKDLRAGKYAPIYFLHGDEPYYIDLVSDFIEHNALAPQERGFNQTVLYGRDANMLAIVNAARKFPVMAQRQVVIVKEAQDLGEWNNDKAKNLLVRYCEKPATSTVLVFAHKKKMDARTQVAKALAKHALVLETKKLYENQLPAWVKELYKGRGHDITDKAAAMLCEYIGNDLARMANEADKLLLNFNKKTNINEEIISTYVGISKEYNTFELQSAIAKKDVRKANLIVNYFESNPKNNPAIPIIALLFGYFTKVLLVHGSTDKSKQAVAALLGINPFFADEYLQAARNYPLVKVVQIVGFLRRADAQAKGLEGDVDDGQILKELVFKILHV